MTAMFIAFEGSDGSGKSTQVSKFVDWAERAGHRPLHTRQPGGTPAGMYIRQVLLNPTTGDLDPMAEALLFAADRAHHVSRLIRPALADGRMVVSDRYVDSSIAYQGYGRGLGGEVVRHINDIATGGVRPDLTIVIDLDPADAHARATVTETDRMEGEGVAFQRTVLAGLRACAAAEPERYAVIDGSGTEDEVHARVVAAFLDHLRRETTGRAA